jgi:hypothetical protein
MFSEVSGYETYVFHVDFAIDCNISSARAMLLDNGEGKLSLEFFFLVPQAEVQQHN